MSKKTLLFAIVGIILLTGIFYLTSKKVPETTTDTSGVKEKVFELTVNKGKIVSGEKILKGTEGDRITLRVTADESDELHLHGYDLATELTANVPGEISFIADKTGRFSIELHHNEAEIGAIEIFPQ